MYLRGLVISSATAPKGSGFQLFSDAASYRQIYPSRSSALYPAGRDLTDCHNLRSSITAFLRTACGVFQDGPLDGGHMENSFRPDSRDRRFHAPDFTAGRNTGRSGAALW